MRHIAARVGCILALAVAIGGIASRAPAGLRASPRAVVEASYVHDQLASSGQWIDHPQYGSCWTPYDRSAGWRPYTDGRWVYTDYGWSWASDEPWGWATYHYGRWTFDATYGWIWIPGTEWAPAWVAWRYGLDYVGWAPLPPSADWSASAGLVFSGAERIPSHEWCFVPRRRMLDANVRAYVTTVARNVTLLSRSHDATRFGVRNGRPADIGIDVGQAGSFVGHRVPRMGIVDMDGPGRRDGRAVGNGIAYYQPIVRPAPAGRHPAESRRAVPPAPDAERRRAGERLRLERDLEAERRSLARDQRSERPASGLGPTRVELGRQHVAERQAFEAHAAQQRLVLAQRMEKRVERPAAARSGAPAQRRDDRSAPPDRNRDRGRREK